MQIPIRVRNLRTTLVISSLRDQDQEQAAITYSIRTEFRILLLKLPLLRPRNINHPINNHMRDMDSLRSEFSSQGLRHDAQRGLPHRERRKVRRPFQTSCCACEDQGGRVVQTG